METEYVDENDYNEDAAKFSKKARRKNCRLVVTNKNKPVFEVRPFTETEAKKAAKEKLLAELNQAEEDIKHGRVYSLDEAFKKFGPK